MELIELFDNKRRPLNITRERYVKENGEYAQTMHIWIRNSKGEFLLQKRSMNKKNFPGDWSITGGGVDSGETTLDAAIRECKEELGIDIDINKTELILTIRTKYNNFNDVYLVTQDFDINDLILQKEEVDEVKWASLEEIDELYKNHEFSPPPSFYYEQFKKIIF